MTSQYLMHCVLRKTLCTSSSVSEIGEPQCCDPENCEINSFKTDNIDWYIINIYYYNSNLIRIARSRQVDRHGSPDRVEFDLY